MSAPGHLQTWPHPPWRSALSSEADVRAGFPDVCFGQKRTHAQQQLHYSITSLARERSVGGTSIPSCFAVLALITSSYLVGACTGISAGFSPLRMRLT